MSAISNSRLVLSFDQEDDTDTSSATEAYSLDEVDKLTANFRELDAERKAFTTTLFARRWTAGRTVPSMLLPHKAKDDPVQVYRRTRVGILLLFFVSFYWSE